MRHTLFVLIICFTGWLAGCSHSSFAVEQVDVRAYIFPDGDVYIEELFTYDVQGEYENMERSIELLGHEGVSFFEAYIPPAGKVLGEFSYEEAKRLDVTYSQKHSAYAATIGANNEKMRVYYRYRLEEAASRFNDRGEFDWNFFVFQNTDLHNVTIETFWPKAFQQTDVSMFAYNRDGGEFTDITDHSIIYQTDFVSEYETLALHFLFPPDYLAERETERTLVSKSEKIKQETERQQSYEERESRLEWGGEASFKHSVRFSYPASFSCSANQNAACETASPPPVVKRHGTASSCFAFIAVPERFIEGSRFFGRGVCAAASGGCNG
jgi:hypothetical protein